jgi:hypothetical protein
MAKALKFGSQKHFSSYRSQNSVLRRKSMVRLGEKRPSERMVRPTMHVEFVNVFFPDFTFDRRYPQDACCLPVLRRR